MAYDTASPPVAIAPSRDGSTPSLWAYQSTDDFETVSGSGYISNALNVGLRAGDYVLVSDTDNSYLPVLTTVASISSGAGTLQTAGGGGQTMTAGAGIDGVAAVYEAGVSRSGGVITTKILIDLTGLNSSAAGDIIGDDGVAGCHIGQITAAVNGTIIGGYVQCLEDPAGGEPDIDLYSATEATGTEDAAITSLTETALLDAGADWTNLLAPKGLSAVPAADEYLYLVGSGAGTDATYTGGIFLITLIGN
ncbi:MAG: hypothetical protein R3186_04995 [Ruegeria sp.]|nr:hypothetical protein [Ruegeria sp.]